MVRSQTQTLSGGPDAGGECTARAVHLADLGEVTIYDSATTRQHAYWLFRAIVGLLLCLASVIVEERIAGLYIGAFAGCLCVLCLRWVIQGQIARHRYWSAHVGGPRRAMACEARPTPAGAPDRRIRARRS